MSLLLLLYASGILAFMSYLICFGRLFLGLGLLNNFSI